ncbi:hypothetical protein BX600DRAFT_519377 [Xylariales sp. PMI_506]|nr:hypothetical protein BX600DRAFT_519377 [Xylariales sp. PMI_506]
MHIFVYLGILPLLVQAFPNPASMAKRSVTCLKVGQTATAKWTTDAGKTCTWTGVVGTNFGTNTVNDGDDPNCGNAYDAASDDTLLGAIDGCGQTNPTVKVSRPTHTPSCT